MLQSTALIITAHSLAFTPSLYSTFGLYKLYHVCTNKNFDNRKHSKNI